jgi:hypothetical protein
VTFSSYTAPANCGGCESENGESASTEMTPAAPSRSWPCDLGAAPTGPEIGSWQPASHSVHTADWYFSVLVTVVWLARVHPPIALGSRKRDAILKLVGNRLYGCSARLALVAISVGNAYPVCSARVGVTYSSAGWLLGVGAPDR